MSEFLHAGVAFTRKMAGRVVRRALRLITGEQPVRPPVAPPVARPVVGETFEYRDYRIPIELVNLTGGGTSTWDEIAQAHLAQYERYTPIQATHSVLEIGCGVGRDAIQLTRLLSQQGSYLGIDIIEPSIRWCQLNITPRFSNFRFVHFNAKSQIHNPNGRLEPEAIVLPVADASVDRVILQSVFTHMFEQGIVNYLREFRRVLRPGGQVFASFFIVDEEIRAKVKDQELHFRHPYADGCFVIDPAIPEGAVAFSVPAIERMLKAGGLEVVEPLHRGFWCGHPGPDGQDVVVMKALGSA